MIRLVVRKCDRFASIQNCYAISQGETEHHSPGTKYVSLPMSSHSVIFLADTTQRFDNLVPATIAYLSIYASQKKEKKNKRMLHERGRKWMWAANNGFVLEIIFQRFVTMIRILLVLFSPSLGNETQVTWLFLLVPYLYHLYNRRQQCDYYYHLWYRTLRLPTTNIGTLNPLRCNLSSSFHVSSILPTLWFD